MSDRPTAKSFYMEERTTHALAHAQHIRCEALSGAVGLLKKDGPVSHDGRPLSRHERGRLEVEVLELAERFEAWIRGEDDA